MKSILFPLLLWVTLLVPSMAAADDLVSEVRGGVFAHDIDFWSFHREGGVGINAEVLFTSPDFLAGIWAPRPHLGVTVNTAGDTSNAYGGLTWEWALPRDFFVDLNLGAAVHDGKTETSKNDRKSLGSTALFRVGGALGYNITEKVNVSIQYEHMSNAYLADPNEGLDRVGLRLGYRF